VALLEPPTRTASIPQQPDQQRRPDATSDDGSNVTDRDGREHRDQCTAREREANRVFEGVARQWRLALGKPHGGEDTDGARPAPICRYSGDRGGLCLLLAEQDLMLIGESWNVVVEGCAAPVVTG